MKESEFDRERFDIFQLDWNGNWWIEDTETYDVYEIGTKEKALDKARAWNYEAAEIALNQFREGC